ncbi:cytochrome P450 [Byssothecium circinans]|uniref:Cytochrome P450 n=1 Tax=Byssothecium circinans TaxID=147558 RepID=A0A6A5T855_9PLEO|nr:cytochrome P450 [Byssothecium circinans]
MFRLLLTALVPLIAVYGIAYYRSLKRNVRLARGSGLRYIVSPVYFQSIPWILLQEALLPILRQLPETFTQSWLPLSLFFRTWGVGYEPFEIAGTDTFIIASAGGNVLWTCDPEVILQLSHRHDDFIKPTNMLGMLNIYGPTITASEGDEHRRYRSIASPSFNENTHLTVWREAIRQAKLMLETWDHAAGHVSNLNLHANQYALHVLSKALFNKDMEWEVALEKPRGHELTYPEAISAVFKYNNTLFMTPQTILNISPVKEHRLARQAFVEFRKYLEEMVEEQTQTAAGKGRTEDINLLQNFVSAARSTHASRIPDAAVFGNLFIFILAGHETSANTMTFALSLLACRPDFQKALQTGIDDVVGGRDPTAWTYPQDYTKIMDGHVGALMNETLRLYTVLPFLPKTNEKAQAINVDGVRHVIAPNTLAMINTSATHRHPKHWPRPLHKSSDSPPYPVSSFQPERWLSKHTPAPGAFIPFAEGFRSCMGSRFARIEFCAAVATICKDYTVELEDGTGPAALAKAEAQLSSGVSFEMGLKLKEPVALKFVRRSG